MYLFILKEVKESHKTIIASKKDSHQAIPLPATESSRSAHRTEATRTAHWRAMTVMKSWSKHHRTKAEERTIISVRTIEPVERIHHPEYYIHDYHE